MRLFAVLSLLLLAACSRPLSENERDFAETLFGPTLDVSEVRVAQGLGVTPTYQTVPSSVRVLRGTERACLRTPQPRGAQPPQAFALYNRIHFNSGLYSSDMVRSWPKGIRFPQALIFAHELTHVWQWQNRDMTGYTPSRAVAESFRLADPYYTGDIDTPLFLSFGYEQQAALLEDYICFAVANPNHPRREQLREVLAPFFNLDEFDAKLGQ